MRKKTVAFLSSYLLILGFTAWIIGFFLFALYALSFKYSTPTRTDAIVVLTGGTDRINTAVSLLQDKYAHFMLISGVNKAVKTADLFPELPADALSRITLGYEAENTKGNAIETANWMRKKNVRSVLLVTSFYHMPRSVQEVLNRNPSIKIVPLPVFPKSFGNSVDWIRTRYAWLLFVEYHKFIVIYLQNKFERIL